ncbi:MAG TPA: adenylosuccinate synthetase [Candidatus Competibacteraceae bacterium]|nr:adenylosuccinate synthetase [Candidatus Competibacteraceae bacterium]
MDRTAQVVIGAQFGDEGKGRITDAHVTAGGARLVVRFNGGAQAGHTVVTPEGRRHVFGHVGSGALAGAPTYLSRFFVCNPLLFLREQAALAGLGTQPVVMVDARSPVTTPYDMLINQWLEQARGTARHGSCGVGFGETLERQRSHHALTVADLADAATLTQRLDALRRDYLPARLARLGCAALLAEPDKAALLQADTLLERFVTDARRFLDSVSVMPLSVAARGRHLLFEGAQGLLLDQTRGFFPHVTRSHTGLRNVLMLAFELGLKRLEVDYVSRVYLTRHGAGPLPGELPGPPYAGISDPTNQPNPYQGSLRFAWLDLDLLGRAIAADCGDAGAVPQLTLRTRLALSCLDQVEDGRLCYQHGGAQRQGDIEALLRALGAATGIDQFLLSDSATRRPLQQYRRRAAGTGMLHAARPVQPSLSC